MVKSGTGGHVQDGLADRLIVALDLSTAAEALDLADSLLGTCRWVKVGLGLFISAGPVIVEKLKVRGFSVFLDLKLHDIPNTVAAAVRSAATTGADMLTVHASGGPAMLAAAAEAAQQTNDNMRLLAVTVLTSMDTAHLNRIGVAATTGDHAPDPVQAQVARLAGLATTAGIGGIVCSANEVEMLRALLGERACLVTPGIRPAGSDTGDQRRTATPTRAIRSGASRLVVGRPITRASDPRAAAEAMQREIAEALLPEK